MTHTPGPWRLKESPHKREFSHFIDAGPEMGSYFIGAVNNGADEAVDASNARLMAAAPELFAAVEMFLCANTPNRGDDDLAEVCQRYGIDTRGLQSSNVHCWAIALPQVMAQIREFASAALAKVEGK